MTKGQIFKHLRLYVWAIFSFLDVKQFLREDQWILSMGKSPTAELNYLYVKSSPIISLCSQTFCGLYTSGGLLLRVL